MSILDFLGKKNEDKSSSMGSLSKQMMAEIRSNMERDFGEMTEKKSELDCFCTALEEELKEYVRRRQAPASEDGQGSQLQAVDALSMFHVSEDHMEAYACIFSPLNDGAEMTQEQFLEDMRYGGITFGIDQEAVSRLVSEREYLRIVQIAQGTWPKDGQDGELEELYERREKQPLELSEEQLRGGFDFRNQNLLQPIHKGEIICRIKEPVMACDGKDVSGRSLPGKAGTAVRIPQGENTRVTEDGLLLLADISGIVVMTGEDFTVQRLNIAETDIDAAAGELSLEGNLLIQGTIKEGAVIKASGDIIIEGSVQGGSIVSGGTIRVRGEIQGGSKTQLRAGKQIQCTIMENTFAAAKEDICAEVIANSTVISEGGGIYALMGRGLIFGGDVKAYKSIYARKIGNVSGCENSIMLGYAPELERQLETVRTEFANTQSVCEKLRKNISDMQAAGMHRQRDKRELYSKLTEQRTLYEELKREKSAVLKGLERQLYALKSSMLTCEEIHPLTQIHIRGKELTIQNRETDCRIHMSDDQILLK